MTANRSSEKSGKKDAAEVTTPAEKKGYLSLDYIRVEGSNKTIDDEIDKKLKEYQDKHGPLAYDQMTIIPLKHPHPDGISLSLVVRKSGAISFKGGE